MTRTLKSAPALLLAGALLAIALFGALAATQAQAAVRHFDGKVVSKSSASRTLRIKTESGNRVRFHVNRHTEFERIRGGFRGLHRELVVAVDAKRTDNGRLAKLVERHRAGGGRRGGGGADNGPSHT